MATSTDGRRTVTIAEIAALAGEVIALLRRGGDMAILLMEQYFDFAHRLAETIAVMERGSIVISGRRDELDGETVRRRLSV